jgi:hypothetical protein
MSMFTGGHHRSRDVDFHVVWSFDHPVTRHPLAFGLILAALSWTLLRPTPVLAEQGEQAWSGGVGLMTMAHAAEVGPEMRFAPVAEISYRYAVDDFWELGGNLGVGVGLGGEMPEASLGYALFESRYVIDAMTWVPYLCFGLGVLLREDGPQAWSGEGGPTVDLTGHAGLGVEWRPARSWSLGLVVKYYLALTDVAGTTGPLHVAFSASWYID